MQLFYHVTRDIELPRARRRPQTAADTCSCEACGRPIAGLGGGASKPGERVAVPATLGGAALRFCDACRDRLERSAIQIHFCDRCGVSVPLGTVERGEALAGSGGILCPACRDAESVGGRRFVFWALACAVAAVVLGIALASIL